MLIPEHTVKNKDMDNSSILVQLMDVWRFYESTVQPGEVDPSVRLTGSTHEGMHSRGKQPVYQPSVHCKPAIIQTITKESEPNKYLKSH